MMQNLCGTKELTLTMELGDRPNWWVDSLYTVCAHAGKDTKSTCKHKCFNSQECVRGLQEKCGQREKCKRKKKCWN